MAWCCAVSCEEITGEEEPEVRVKKICHFCVTHLSLILHAYAHSQTNKNKNRYEIEWIADETVTEMTATQILNCALDDDAENVKKICAARVILGLIKNKSETVPISLCLYCDGDCKQEVYGSVRAYSVRARSTGIHSPHSYHKNKTFLFTLKIADTATRAHVTIMLHVSMSRRKRKFHLVFDAHQPS